MKCDLTRLRMSTNMKRVVDKADVPVSDKNGPPAAGKILKCYRCGFKNHLADTCRFKSLKCFKCNKIGHSSKMCDNFQSSNYFDEIVRESN